MVKLKISFYMDIMDTALSNASQLSQFCEQLPKTFKIIRYGASELASELTPFHSFTDPEYQAAIKRNTGFFVLRMTGYIVNFMFEDDWPNSLSIRVTVRDFEKKIRAINEAWQWVIPDGHGFYSCYTGYAAHSGDPNLSQGDSEYVNRFPLVVHFPSYHAETKEYLYDAGQYMAPLGKGNLDLLPGLMWRIGMGEHHFEKYNISPEEISKVCVSTEETTAANGDKLWKFQSREDPLNWRDSYERQLKLNRPDVFFDIAPLRERFADPVDIKDSGRGDELDKLFKRALIELYPENATRGIKV